MKRFLKNFIAKHLFKMIVDSDFIRLDEKTGQLYLGNHLLNKTELESFAKSAKDLKNNDVYVLIMREMWNVGEKKIFFEGEAARDHGRSVLWTLDLIIKKVDNLSKLGGKK